MTLPLNAGAVVESAWAARGSMALRSGAPGSEVSGSEVSGSGVSASGLAVLPFLGALCARGGVLPVGRDGASRDGEADGAVLVGAEDGAGVGAFRSPLGSVWATTLAIPTMTAAASPGTVGAG